MRYPPARRRASCERAQKDAEEDAMLKHWALALAARTAWRNSSTCRASASQA
eukprot:CAMPEP_0204031782 /NCGR_PEP_ID=MMETSP0360-20130528/65202_1 /ASSEMBLY_ACC=CAM_ASM_000342 /TAXON_ID=268821 /ORGANISM="Scrippsiella Hangoei, Strain SHTV-5" /LENGTH=51 /DNA_ID=CAMNT_0050976081 /DNA_START=163 /DNA_END=314 /DNA_ORIENTATION=+